MPSGMWSAPGHNPMMESQWTAHYQTMPQNQVSPVFQRKNHLQRSVFYHFCNSIIFSMSKLYTGGSRKLDFLDFLHLVIL